MVAADGSGGYAGTVSYGAGSAVGGRAVLWKNGKFTDYGNLADPPYENWVSIVGVNTTGTVAGIAYRQADGFPSAIRRSRTIRATRREACCGIATANRA
ncbi:hypothetical protein ACH4FX_19610 [Streptomyces sp. NPDC018019]|uniref:hypothetical protein n=1 Tax=Streptomyces sp. NPDC018019 TaxID=3365030 RepID=UPI00378F1F69